MRTFIYSMIILFFCTLCPNTSYGQLQVSTLKPRQIRKLQKVEAAVDGKKMPVSYLYGMRKGNLVILMDISDSKSSPIFVEKELPLEKYDYLLVSNPKEARKKSLIYGLVLGGLTYFLVKEATKSNPADATPLQQVLKQPGNSGQLEGIAVGITGMGLGMIIGGHFSKRKVDLKLQHSKSLRQLDAFQF